MENQAAEASAEDHSLPGVAPGSARGSLGAFEDFKIPYLKGANVISCA